MDGRTIAAAWQEFKVNNSRLFDGAASGVYLANRLEHAYLAGIEVAEAAMRAPKKRIGEEPKA